MFGNALFIIGKRLAQVPGLRLPVIRLWNTYEHVLFVYSAHQNLSAQPLVAYVNPLKIYQVSPENIKKMSASSFDFIQDTGLITNGSWDLRPTDIKETSKYQLFKKRFVEGCDWQEIQYYKRKKSRIKNKQTNRYVTVAEFEKKLTAYDQIYDLFCSGQYQLQSELANKNKPKTPGDGGQALFPSLTNHTLLRHEIAINVGRHGTLLRNDGRHRLALALLAGLDEVPVRIVVRHSKWQSLRDRVAQTIDEARANNVSPENIKNHVSEVLSDELAAVDGGVDHPDLNNIFDRRLTDKRPKLNKPKQAIPYIRFNR